MQIEIDRQDKLGHKVEGRWVITDEEKDLKKKRGQNNDQDYNTNGPICSHFVDALR